MILTQGHLYKVKITGHLEPGVLLYSKAKGLTKPTIIKSGSIVLYLGKSEFFNAGNYLYNGELFEDSLATRSDPYFYFEPLDS